MKNSCLFSHCSFLSQDGKDGSEKLNESGENHGDLGFIIRSIDSNPLQWSCNRLLASSIPIKFLGRLIYIATISPQRVGNWKWLDSRRPFPCDCFFIYLNRVHFSGKIQTITLRTQKSTSFQISGPDQFWLWDTQKMNLYRYCTHLWARFILGVTNDESIDSAQHLESG